MLSCQRLCLDKEVGCPCEDCRLWIPSEQHYNCINNFIASKAGEVNNYAKIACGVGKKGEGDVICTQQDVADVFGVTREAIRQTEVKALKRLKKLLKGW